MRMALGRPPRAVAAAVAAAPRWRPSTEGLILLNSWPRRGSRSPLAAAPVGRNPGSHWQNGSAATPLEAAEAARAWAAAAGPQVSKNRGPPAGMAAPGAVPAACALSRRWPRKGAAAAVAAGCSPMHQRRHARRVLGAALPRTLLAVQDSCRMSRQQRHILARQRTRQWRPCPKGRAATAHLGEPAARWPT